MSDIPELQAIRFLVQSARIHTWIAVDGHDDIDREDMLHCAYTALDAALDKLQALEDAA